MKFKELSLKGVYLIELEKIEDERGFFSRSWDKKIFENKGLNSNLSQCNISFNKNKGTVRGMHFQKKPYEEAKIIRCTKGRVFEVMIDIRINSPTFHKWISVELCEDKYEILYVPEGFALGFQTLSENTELYYQMSEYYHPEKSGGIRWNDPKIQIKWPLDCSTISKKDESFDLL
ncbi:MAG: dTDP-4-dehydrorhamnose 3,5-epimerase [Nitrosopumilus sp.]|nr:dTDP-4-dehydrorhamnose 3,5-epimerase [Nitrosopumilus sp.]